MLSVIMTAFLSFSIISGTCTSNDLYGISEASELHDMSLYEPKGSGGYTTNVPSVSSTTGEYEASSWKNGLIGRHQMVSIQKTNYEGVKVIKKLSPTIYSNGFQNTKFIQSCSYITENSISTTLQVTVTVAAKIAAEISVAGVKVGAEGSVSTSFSVSNTQTYTYREEVTNTIELEVDKSVVSGKNFAICQVAHVFSSACKQWQYDDYWWGKYTVSGTENTFTTYVFADLGIAVVLEDGTII